MNKRDTVRLDSAASAASSKDQKQGSIGGAAEIDAAGISALVDFFKLLDKWEQEAKRQ